MLKTERVMGQENQAYKTEERTTLVQVDAKGAWSVELPDGVSATRLRITVYDTQNANALVTQQRVTQAEMTSGVVATVTVAENKPLHLVRTQPKVGKFVRITVHGKIMETDTAWTNQTMRVLFENKDTQQVFFTINTDSEGNFSAYLQGSNIPLDILVYPQAYPHLAQSVSLAKWDADNVLLFLLDEQSNAKAAATPSEDPIYPIKDDCNCNGVHLSTPNAPSNALLTGINQLFSQDINGCESLTRPDRTVEEFRFFKVMRTTTPLVRGYIQENEDGKAPMLRKNEGGPLWLSLDYPIPWDKGQQRAYNGYELNSSGAWQPNAMETYLDDNKRVFQAVTFGYGLTLVFKQRYIADGHSKGQLLNSLPLAPGQKEQVAILSWDREDTASRSEASEASDMLTANLSRNRDISDIASGTVRETVNASSSGGSFANTGGFSVAADLSFIGVPLGVSGGYQGSSTNFNSEAMQDAVRNTSMSSMQNLRDATNQSASSVRSQRNTVVQTSKQSERVAAKSSVIANHNHCHSITVFYHEVLAHYLIQQSLVDVKECIFIPMQMQPFDGDKIVRYLNVLKRAALFSPKHPMWADFEAIEKGVYGLPEPAARIAGPNTVNTAPVGAQHAYLQGSAVFSFEITRPTEPMPLSLSNMTNTTSAWYNLLILLQESGMIDANGKGIGNVFSVAGTKSIMQYYKDADTAEKDDFFIIMKTQVIKAYINAVADVRFSVGCAVLVDGNSAESFGEMNLKTTNVSGGNQHIVSVQFLAKFDPISFQANPLSHGFFHLYCSYPLSAGSTVTVKNLTLALSYDVASGFSKFAVSANTTPVYFDLDTLTGITAKIPLKSDSNAAPYIPPPPPAGVTQRLIDHLNQNLEYYHRAIWYAMDRETRFNILDGIVFYKTFTRKNAAGQDETITINTTVASIVDNVLLGVAGNSLVMPVADGVDIGNYTVEEGKRLFDVFNNQIKVEEMRISVPTKGVFAEMQMGECCVCEKRDDSLMQDWSFATTDEPTAISTLNTDSRYQAPPNMQAKDFAQPIINIQNAPAAPDPQGFGAMAGILGSSGLFKDMTGLEGGQKLAQATLEQTVEMQKQYAGAAERIAGYAQAQHYNNNANRIMDNIRKSGLPKNEQDDLVRKFLGNMVPGGGDKKEVAVVPTAQDNIDAASKLPAGSKFTQNTNGAFSAEIGGNANQNPLNGINTIIADAADTYTPDVVA